MQSPLSSSLQFICLSAKFEFDDKLIETKDKSDRRRFPSLPTYKYIIIIIAINYKSD